MTQQTPYPPAMPYQAPPQQQPPRNGIGITGFVLGLVGLVFSPIPFIGVVAWPLVILGLIFSIFGVVRVNKGVATNKVLSIVGIVASVIGLGVCVAWLFIFNQAVNEVQDEYNRTAAVTYDVTGDATGVEVTYGEALNPISETVDTLPWTKQMENKGVIKGGMLTVMADETGGEVTCKITVDGAVVATNTASGPFAVAICTGA
ncbi:MmpS family transport accessory protein [Amycolatopsis magusensis]|uniref:Energy-coupling factor transporter transmembrane protein EcfT n=1 Tax=Amycolatopsis magusensis TaxID=882444 RepID=A0ABS4PHA7_9PSEU|nr:MmpS family transport accessory protein [Amycolatopsis magusensis]MBP2178792.1 energy-coupling factor transporter transmembrane protein EcfT [Amycolatopsis magusensis]MDI5980240.1 MmpS family transport accessory protein [Amycolatopsis magusensis]